jgi:hypothetical protein
MLIESAHKYDIGSTATYFLWFGCRDFFAHCTSAHPSQQPLTSPSSLTRIRRVAHELSPSPAVHPALVSETVSSHESVYELCFQR